MNLFFKIKNFLISKFDKKIRIIFLLFICILLLILVSFKIYQKIVIHKSFASQNISEVKSNAIWPCLGDGTYVVYDNDVRFQNSNNTCGKVEWNADVATFEVLKYGFARDKNNGYYRGQTIEIRNGDDDKDVFDVDGPTFEVLSENYAKDKNFVYFLDGKSYNRSVIKDADPNTFVVLSKWFGKDAKNGYYGWSPILESDGPTFELVDYILSNKERQYGPYGFAKDKTYVFLGDEIIKGADPKTFHVYKDINSKFNSFYSRDAKKVYNYTYVLGEVDPDSFQIVEESKKECDVPYYKDKDYVYYGGKKVEGADVKSFKYIGTTDRRAGYQLDILCLGIDKKNVFAQGNKIQDVEPDSFQQISPYYFKNKDNVFYASSDYLEKINGADPSTFELISKSTAKDKKSIYIGDVLVMPNLPGYKLLEGGYCGTVGPDVYCEGNIIKEADSSTFSHIGGEYAKDKNHVFFDGNIIPGADPKTFELSPIEIGVAYDKNSEYVNGRKIQNDFISCSTDVSKLPVEILDKISITNNDDYNPFKFCEMTNHDKIVGYSSNLEKTETVYSWFDSKNQLINTISFECGGEEYDGVILPHSSIRNLRGSILTIMCIARGVCEQRVFYELDLNEWKLNKPVFRANGDSYDCGYRG